MLRGQLLPSMSVRIVTRSERETEEIGEFLAASLSPGTVVGLTGPLGAGKTALVRGIARGCGVEEGVVHSPTFLTAAEYAGRVKVTHLDLYRHEETLPDLDWLAEILDGASVAVVEWFEHLRGETPEGALRVEIAYGEAEDVRVLNLNPQAALADGTLALLSARRSA